MEPTDAYETVGVVVHCSELRIRHKPRRAWRLYLACDYLLATGGSTGLAVRFVGYVVNHFLLLRPALAVIDHLYLFVHHHLFEFANFDRATIAEIREIQGLIFLAEADIGRPWAPIAFCSDSSALGYALHAAYLDDDELVDLGRHQERWRFKLEEEEFIGQGIRRSHDGWSADWAGPHELLPDRPPLPAVRSSTLRPREVARPPRVETEQSDIGILPVAGSVLAAYRWQLLVKGAWASTSIIHWLEGRIALGGLFRASSDVPFHGHRVASLGDNMSSLLACLRGRARDWGLRQLCRRSAAHQIAAEITWHLRYVESERNPTDHDSRAADRSELSAGQRRKGHTASIDLLFCFAFAKVSFKFGEALRPRETGTLGTPPRALPFVERAAAGTFRPPPGLEDVSPSVRLSRRVAPSSLEKAGLRDLPCLRGHLPEPRVLPGLQESLPGPRDLPALRGPLPERDDNLGPLRDRPVRPRLARPAVGLTGGQPRRDHAARALQVLAVRRRCAEQHLGAQQLPITTTADDDDLNPKQDVARLKRLLRHKRAFIEIYAGCSLLTAAVAGLGLEAACPLEILRGAHFDLHDHRIFRAVADWIKKRKLWYVHFGTPCTMWSAATTSTRAQHIPHGMKAAQLTLKLLRLCRQFKVHWSLENPASSQLWNWPPLLAFLAHESTLRVRVDCVLHVRLRLPQTHLDRDRRARARFPRVAMRSFALA